jgi:hypothetical protein
MKRPDRSWRVLVFAAVILFAPAVQAQSKAPETVRYTVKTGDTLLGLTAQYLTGATAYDALLRANDFANPERIQPGRVILVPVSILRSTPLQAKVASYKGAVSLRIRGKNALPAVGLAVHEGDLVQTGVDGFVTIILSNGSRMTMPTKSKVRLLHMRQFLLTKSTDFDFLVESGRTEMSVIPSRDPNNLFRLRTPIAVSAVRGTTFRIGYDGQANPSLTEVLEGKVAVDGPSASAASAMVPAGYGAAAAASGEVGTEELLPAPAIEGASKVWRAKMLDFNVVPVPTAKGYHLQLAKDAGFQDMVAEARSPTTKLTVGGIANGNYFARAMAIAPSGLEGLSETVAIRRDAAPLIGSVYGLDNGRYQFRWETDGRGQPVFRLQLFSAASPTMPIIDETGMTTYAMSVNGLAAGDYSWRVGMRRVIDGVMSEFWTEAESMTVSGKGK